MAKYKYRSNPTTDSQYDDSAAQRRINCHSMYSNVYMMYYMTPVIGRLTDDIIIQRKSLVVLH